MKKAILLSVCSAGVTLTLSGCSSLFGPEGYFKDRGDDYLKADVLPAISVPEGVESKQVDQLYVVPAIAAESEAPESFEIPRPLSLSDTAFTERVKIQKLEDNRWILVSARPAEVWPQVRGFLSRNNLDVVYSDASTGVIETGWLRFTNDDATQNRYRLRIEQGIQPESTEIHVLHLSVPNAVAESGEKTVWPQRSTNLEREGWLVDELSGVIATDTGASQAASLMAQSIGFGDKVTLDGESEEPVLQIRVDKTRALATLTHAMQSGGFTTWEKQTDRGIFYVTYDDSWVEEEEEPGMVSRILSTLGTKVLGLNRGKEEKTMPYTLQQILTNLQISDSQLDRSLFPDFNRAEAAALHQVPGYLVVMIERAGVAEIRIRDAYGQKLPRKQAKRLLSIARQNLI